MSFYDEIAKDIKWETTTDITSLFKVRNGSLLLPTAKWLQYHLNYLDKVIEAIQGFKQGIIKGTSYDVSKISKRIISNAREGINFLHYLSSQYSLFAIDIETSNLETSRKSNRLLCVGIAYEKEKGVSFLKECFEDTKFYKAFQDFIALDKNKFILHNGVYDRSRMKILTGIELKISEDTLLKHYCGINEHKGTHGLKDLAQLYLGFPEWEEALDVWKRNYCRANKLKIKNFKYDYFSQVTLAEYNIIDCCATYQLNEVFTSLMRPASRNIYYKLIEASQYYADMIARGFKMNMKYWKQLNAELTKNKKSLEAELDRIMPCVNINSPIQLLHWLNEHFPNDNIETTGVKTLEAIQEKHPDDIAIDTILKYRKNEKFLKTYVTSLNEKKDEEGVIHCEFKLYGTETGRLSSTNPNMQNIPRDSTIKNLFEAREGYILIQLDYSQAELRTLAHISGDENLIQCYIDGRDLHSEMAQRIFGDKYDAHNKDQRMIAKTINFGIPFGRTAIGVASQLKIDRIEAQKYLDKWFEGAPKVKEYIKKCHEMTLSEPSIPYYTAFGRTRTYFITGENINHTKNQCVNFPISSTANDFTIYSFCEICKWLKENKYDAYPVNTVHDSIIIEARPEDANAIANYCQDVMASIPKKYLENVRVPFRADVEFGKSYGDMSEENIYFEEEEEEEEEDEQ